MSIAPIHIDNHLIVVKKPGGVPAQNDATRDRTILDMVRDYIKEEYRKPGNVYLGLVHRLDRPVSGVMVFARTSKASARLSEQFRANRPHKIYWALVQGKTRENGRFVDYIHRSGATSLIVSQAKGKRAELSYTRLGYRNGVSYLAICLKTGRHHQIRVQFAHREHFVLGDFRYGSKVAFPRKTVALHARSITICHPTKCEEMTFQADPESYWPKEFFENDKLLLSFKPTPWCPDGHTLSENCNAMD